MPVEPSPPPPKTPCQILLEGAPDRGGGVRGVLVGVSVGALMGVLVGVLVGLLWNPLRS